MPESHEDPNAYKVQLAMDKIIRHAQEWRALKADVAAAKALIADLRAYVTVSSGDIDFAAAKAKAPTWKDAPNPEADRHLIKVNKAIKLIEGL